MSRERWTPKSLKLKPANLDSTLTVSLNQFYILAEPRSCGGEDTNAPYTWNRITVQPRTITVSRATEPLLLAVLEDTKEPRVPKPSSTLDGTEHCRSPLPSPGVHVAEPVLRRPRGHKGGLSGELLWRPLGLEEGGGGPEGSAAPGATTRQRQAAGFELGHSCYFLNPDFRKQLV